MPHARHDMTYYWDEHDDTLYTDAADAIAELCPALAPTQNDIKYVLVTRDGTLILDVFRAKPEPEVIMCIIDEWLDGRRDPKLG